jgi:hypothetical protein
VRNHATFEGGPLDGAVLSWEGELFLSEITVGVPAKMPGDTDRWTGQAIYQYVVTHSSQVDGQKDVSHFMAYLTSKRERLPGGGLENWDSVEPAP